MAGFDTTLRSVTLCAMSEAERDAFVDASLAAYAKTSTEAGRWTAGMADLRAAALARNGAQERAAAGECFLHIMGDGARRGAAWLAPSYDELYLLKLEIAPEHRHKGWGSAALRAIEAFARERGVLLVALNVYSNNPAAITLYQSHGLAVSMQGMVKMLGTTPPSTNPRLTASNMDDASRAAFLAASSTQWADSMVRSGRWPATSRDERLQAARDRLIDKLALPSQHTLTLRWDDQPCGVLWLDLDAGETYVMELALDEAFQGRGIGRAAMAWAEAEAHRLGAQTLALNVFSDNARAIALYEGCGLRTVSYQMIKRIG